jgi:hypothetical protein
MDKKESLGLYELTAGLNIIPEWCHDDLIAAGYSVVVNTNIVTVSWA